MVPTLEDVVAAFRAKQLDEDEDVRARKAKAAEEKEAYSRELLVVVQEMKSDVGRAFSRLLDNDLVSISTVQPDPSNKWVFAVRCRCEDRDNLFSVREGVKDSAKTDILKFTAFKQKDVWYYAFFPTSYDHTSDRTEFLLRVCEKAGRMEAKEGIA